MSRLIFEGDTTERFGKLFPKPFIQEIRVYDNAIQADVMLFLEVPLEQAETDNLIGRINENLRVFGAFLEQDQFNRTINPDSQEEFYRNSFFTLAFNTNDFKKTFPLQNIEYHYNSGGKRFAKCLVTFDYTGISSFLNIARDRYFAAFTSFTTPSFELDSVGITDEYVLRTATESENTLYRNQTSDLVYEKIFNADGTLNTGKQNVYQEPDGNYYGKTPLQSLGKIYKQTNKITHQRVIDLVNPVVSPYVGSIPEADKISMTLSQYSNDPALLTQLEKDINSFTNKSSATTTGQLYSQLVDVVTDIDNLLQAEPTLNKRLETNTKIKDERGNTLLFRDEFSTSRTPWSPHLGDDNYIYEGLRSRSAFVSERGGSAIEQEYKVKNNAFVFFDFKKAINYRSEISKFLNPYNIEEIFGKNCLNSFFEIPEVITDFYIDSSSPSYALTLNGTSSYTFSPYTTDAYGEYFSEIDQYDYDPEAEPIRSQIAERYFDTLDGLNGYPLKCYQMNFLSPIANLCRFSFEVNISDKTMEFYNTHIVDRVMRSFDLFTKYVEYANEFCSYNNLDNRFNDFFVDSVSDVFPEQKLPWENGPLIYYSMLSLLQTSYYDLESFDNTGRNRDGSNISLSLVKQRATMERNKICPESGDLNSLNEFYEKFINLKNIFTKGSGLDQNNSIYDPTRDGNVLIAGDVSKDFDIASIAFDSQIIDSYEIVPVYKARQTLEFNAEETEELNYSEALEILNSMDRSDRQRFGTYTIDVDNTYYWNMLFDFDSIQEATDQLEQNPSDNLENAMLNVIPAFLAAKYDYGYGGTFANFIDTGLQEFAEISLN